MILAYRCLRKTKKKDWWDGLSWMIWAILGGLLPLILTLFVLLLFKGHLGLGTFTDNGEFGLYAASFLASAMYLVVNDSRSFPSRSALSWIISISAILSSVMYVVMTLLRTLGQSESNGGNISSLVIEIVKGVDFGFVRGFSVFMLVGACVLSYLVVVIDNYQMDLQKSSKDEFKSLEAGFDALGSDTKQGAE